MPRTINAGLVALAALTAAAAVLGDPSVDRRASMGFMGMRGKKDDQGGGGRGPGDVGNDETSAAAAVELDKRTIVYHRSPSFAGGRIVADGGSAEGFKRAMGFVGMRGKKEYYKGSAAAAGFFGLRGKKVPSADAFFGVRGKKWPTAMAVPRPPRDRDDDDDNDDVADVRRAVIVLHNIIDDLRSDDRGEQQCCANKLFR